MPLTVWVSIGLAAVLSFYAVAALMLIVAGRRSDARALAGFIPDCVVLVRRLLSDPRVPRRRKLLLGLLVGYLVAPLDLVPDFIPVAGQLDDAILVALVLRTILRAGGDGLLRDHWPGPEQSRLLVQRLACGRRLHVPRGERHTSHGMSGPSASSAGAGDAGGSRGVSPRHAESER